jgi:hypothetical protein
MISLSEFQALQEAIARAKTDGDRAAGVLSKIKEDLQTHFGCANITEAKEKLARLEAEAEKQEKLYRKALKLFKSHYGDLL